MHFKYEPVPSAFADITPMLAHFPTAPAAVDDNLINTQLMRYSVQAGPLLPLLAHLQRWQKRNAALHHPRLCAFASHYPADTDGFTHKTITALQSDSHPLKQLAAGLNADLRVYELDLAQTQRSVQQAAQAMTYGMLAIEDKSDVIVIASLSAGAEQAAHNLELSTLITQADDVLESLVPQMGLDFFAALGACLAARLAGIPVLTCGIFGGKVQAVLAHLQSTAADHLYECAPNEITSTSLPVFAAVQNLQQIRFLLSFLPAPLPVVHVHPV